MLLARQKIQNGQFEQLPTQVGMIAAALTNFVMWFTFEFMLKVQT